MDYNSYISLNRNKVLVSSITCWNSSTGSDTLSNLLDEYGADCVANIYIKEGSPDSPVCNNYFHISEGAVLRSVFNKRIITGKVFEKTNNVDCYSELAEKKRYRLFSKHRFSIFLMLRELGWSLGKWNSQALDDFVDQFSPDVIFFPIESYIYFNRLNIYLIHKTGKKAIGFLWDDNFTYKSVHGLGQKILRFFTRRSVKKLALMCDTVLSINPKMKKECDEFLGVNSVILSKGIDYSNSAMPNYSVPNEPIKLLYSGKLNIGRDKSALILSDVIKKFNTNNQRVRFDIYSMTQLSESKGKKLNSNGCFLHDPVPQYDLRKIQDDADVLVYLEALSGKYRNAARLSFSTKITDYLSAGKCVLAIGPDDIAPIDYFKEEKIGFVASTKEELEQAIINLLEDKTAIVNYGMKAYELGKNKHDIICIRETLWSLLNKQM